MLYVGENRLLIFLWLFLATSITFAADESPQNFTYQGRYFNGDGTLPLTGIQRLTFTILNPAADCTVYEEWQDVNLGTNGLFAVKIGTGTRTDTTGLSLAHVFSNSSDGVVAAGAGCAGGYTPVAGDSRQLKVTYNSIALSANQIISSVPQALVSQTLQGKGADSFIQVVGSVDQPKMESLVDGSEVSTLHNHDNRYVQLGSTLGVGFSTAPGSDIEIRDADPTFRLTGTSNSAAQYSRIDFYGSTGPGGAGSVNTASITSRTDRSELIFSTAGTEALRIDNSQNFVFSGSLTTSRSLGLGQYTTGNETSLVTAMNLAPSSYEGTIWYNAETDTLKFFTYTPPAGAGVTRTVATTDAVVNTVTASAPLVSSGGVNPNISLAQATSSANGYLSSTDWSAFDAKVDLAGDTMTGALINEVSIGLQDPGAGSNVVTIQAAASSDAYTLTLPPDNGDNGEVLTTDGNGNLTWTAGGGGGSGTVTSVTANAPLSVTNTTTTPDITLGTVPIANGGTNNNSLAVTNGGVIYADGSKLMNSGAGTAGYLLQANGAAAPSWIQATDANTGSTIVKRDASGNFSAADPSANDHVATKQYTTSTFLPLAGGTLTGNVLHKVSLQLEDPDGGTDAVTIQASSSLAAPYTLTLPTTDGDPSQVLMTNGSGVLSWTTPSTTDSTKVALAGDTMTGALINKVSIGLEDPAGGTNVITLQAPTTPDVYTLTLPTDNGDNGEVLTTDGNGALSWAAASATDATKLPLAGGTMTGSIVFGAATTFQLQSQVADGGTAFAVHSYYTYTSGKLLTVNNNNSEKFSISSNGNVAASGQIYSASYNAAGGASIDFNNGNLQYTSAAPGAITLSNMQDGGAYTLVCTSTTSGTFTFSHTGLTFKYVPTNGNTIANSYTVYTFIRVGTNVLVSWISGYQ